MVGTGKASPVPSFLPSRNPLLPLVHTPRLATLQEISRMSEPLECIVVRLLFGTTLENCLPPGLRHITLDPIPLAQSSLALLIPHLLRGTLTPTLLVRRARLDEEEQAPMSAKLPPLPSYTIIL